MGAFPLHKIFKQLRFVYMLLFITVNKYIRLLHYNVRLAVCLITVILTHRHSVAALIDMFTTEQLKDSLDLIIRRIHIKFTRSINKTTEQHRESDKTKPTI